MALAMLGLPGAVFIYNGEDSACRTSSLPDEALRDPVWERSGHTRRGPRRLPGAGAVGRRRTAVRVLRQSRHLASDPAGVGDADGGEAAPEAIPRCRSSGGNRIAVNRPEFGGSAVEWLDSPSTWCFGSASGLVCALNAGRRAMSPAWGEVLLASGALVDGQLPPNTAAWLV
jgi:alpha-glucosidase